MNIEYNNFIGIYNNVYPEGYCKHLIDEFDKLENLGCGSNRFISEGAPPTHKDDFQIMCTPIKKDEINYFEGKESVSMFFKGLQACYDDYTNKFSTLRGDRINSRIMKMQRTPPGGGYHVWHHEQGNDDNAGRVLVYMLYLNSLKEEQAGETEFLYQQLRFKPTENQMILWPASYTHVHRGNAVFGENSKYVVTGWFYYE